MTNDESEIRRLAHAALQTPCPSFFENDFVHRHECDRIADAIRTALAAEREQHARDVAEAEARTWREAAKVAGNAILDRRNDISDFGLGVKHSARLLFSECKRKGEAMACAQALNDSRPPSGINQGSGAGEAAKARAFDEILQARRTWGVMACNDVAFAMAVGKITFPWVCDEPAECSVCHVRFPHPAPGTGGTWRCGKPECIFDKPASAPGGAPGVETCGTCKGHGRKQKRGYPEGEFEDCGVCGGTGTTPTPSTETPTGGR